MDLERAHAGSSVFLSAQGNGAAMVGVAEHLLHVRGRRTPG